MMYVCPFFLSSPSINNIPKEFIGLSTVLDIIWLEIWVFLVLSYTTSMMVAFDLCPFDLFSGEVHNGQIETQL